MSRKDLKKYISKTAPVMEIGPLDKPFISKDEYDVYYSDIRNTNDVIEIYVCSDSIDKTKIVPIDYVIENTYIDAVDEKRFSAVFSSHVIEHTLDIIGHLNEIAQILKTDGVYALCIPDKRVTFDCFREVTPFRDAYDIHVNGVGAERLILDHLLNVKGCIDIKDIYNHSFTYEKIVSVEAMADDILNNVKNTPPGNVHYWVFTFESFLALIRDCLRLNLLPYTLEYACGTILMSNEFYIVLKKNMNIMSNVKMRQAEILKINRLIEQPKGQRELTEFISRHNLIYIYGLTSNTKYIIEAASQYRNKIAGVIISDGFEKEDFELPVYHLSEVSLRSDDGIILAMGSEHNRELVSDKLKKIGFNNILKELFID